MKTYFLEKLAYIHDFLLYMLFAACTLVCPQVYTSGVYSSSENEDWIFSNVDVPCEQLERIG